jgi:predicted CoA-binding protein
MSDKKTIVLGASPKKSRFSNKAVKSLIRYGYPVVPIGRNQGDILGHPIKTAKEIINNVHTITIYLNPKHQEEYYNYILNEIVPNRVIFNPGAENQDFMQILMEQGIHVDAACTLIMLNTGKY